jgi:hypothetical protein
LSVTGATSITNTTSSVNTTTGALVVSGGVGVGGRLNVAGATALSSTLGVSGATTLSSTLSVTGATSITNTTASTNTTTGALIVSGGVGIGGRLNVAGATALSSNATVGGTLGVSGATILSSTLSVTGATSITNTTASTNTTTGALVVSGGVGVGGRLNVAGATALSNTLSVTGATTLSSTLGVSGITNITNTTASTNTTTGALVVSGGVGVGGRLNVAGATALSSTLGVSGATTLSSTLGVSGATALSSTLGVSGATTLSSTLGVSGITNITNTTASTNTTTGALVVSGGVGVGGRLNVAGATALSSTLSVTGATSITNTTASTNTTTGALVVSGGVGVGGRLNVAGATALSSTLSVTGATSITNTTASTNTTTGALRVSGGVGVAGNLSVPSINGFTVEGASGNRWTNIPTVGSGGVMEIGRYIDFHSTAGDTTDFTYRIDNSSNGNLSFSGNLGVSGATTVSSTLGVTGATTLSSTLSVTGATTVGGTLGVAGKTTITKNAHTSGADDCHLELFSNNINAANEVSLRMHQASQFFGQIRLRSNGFHFTQGNNNTYRDIFFGTATGSLSGNATTATTAANLTRSVIAGNGLTGGGVLNDNRTLTVGAGSGISVSVDDVAVDSTVVRTTGNQTIGGIKTFTSTISGSINGNAATADTLKTARTIGGVSFNGSANINLPGVNIAGTQDTSGNAATATNLSTNRTNWVTNGTLTAVVGQLAWRNFGNNHTIFDASAGLSPNGTSVNNTNSANAWIPTYPTLMGWNGSTTYGVRVDSARLADTATNCSRRILSGDGMNFTGGQLNTDRTITLGTPGDLTGTSTSAVTATSHTHKITVNLGVTAGTTAGPIITSSAGTNATIPTASATASGVVTTGNQTWAGIKTFNNTISGSINGNAATADTLKTARTIGGVSFNGSANINLPGVNIAGTQDTSGNAATATTATTATTAAQANKINRNAIVATNTSSFRVLLGEANNASGFRDCFVVTDASRLLYQPSTNTLTCGIFAGALNGNATTATNAQGSTFSTASTTSESRFTVRFSGQNDAYLFSNGTRWGLFSNSGGVVLEHVRSTGVNAFNGNATTATTATTAANLTRSVIAGNGLTGGGVLNDNRTLTVGAGSGISVSVDAVAVDSTVIRDSGPQTIGGIKTFSNKIRGSIDGNADGNAATATTAANLDRSVTGGNGLSGGGTLTSDHTINLREPRSVTATSINDAGTNTTGHTHNVSNSLARDQTANSSVGAVGTYAFLKVLNDNDAVDPGQTRSGSGLVYSNGRGNKTWDTGGNVSPSGTWRCMGRTRRFDNFDDRGVTLWLRIS